MKYKSNFLILIMFFPLLTVSSLLCSAQQPLIQITAPANNSLAMEGTTITITVAVDSSVQNVGVISGNPLPEVQGTSSANQFSLTLPSTIPAGLYNLRAIGTNSTGLVESAPVAIDVERQFVPTSITANPSWLNLSLVGNQFPIRVIGTFGDGSTLDITRSNQMVFTSNNTQIATVSSSGMITAVSPGQTYITSQAGGGTIYSYAVTMVTVAPQPPPGTPPVITSISPASGIPGTTPVTINGSGFGATQGSGYVQIGTLNGVVTSWNDQLITAIVPAGSENGVVEVDQNGLYSNSVAFAVSVPVIQSISSASLVPGTQVTLTGTGFGAAQGQGSVGLGPSYPVPVVSWADNMVVVTVPTGTTPGVARVGQNGVFSNSVNFTMTPAALSSIAPTSLVPGGQLTLNGNGFGANQGQGEVTLNSSPVPILTWGDLAITLLVPDGTTPGIVQVGQNGVFSNPVNFTMTPPVLTSLSSTNLSTGMQITLHGSGFGANQGQGSVALNNSYPVPAVSWSDTGVTVTVPAGTCAGPAEVGQNGVFSNPVSFTMAPSVLMSISPSPLIPGGQAFLHGSGFGATQGQGSVELNNSYPVPVVSWNDTDITVSVPEGTTAGGAQVGQNCVFSNAVSFTVQ